MTSDFGFYWALCLRRFPMMILFVLLFSGLGLVTAFKLPDTYSTSAKLLFEAQQIPENMVASTIQTGAAEQLDVIQQRLMTRANLIDIANRFDVFEDLREMEPDRVYAAMREATTVRRRSGAGGRATTMQITFDGRSPRIVADVVNEYVTIVLQENSRFRVTRAENTLDFFEQEVQRLDDELNRQSANIDQFKRENAEALPQDQAYRLGRQNLLQERLDRLERELSVARQRRGNLENSFETPSPALSGYQEELIVQRAELARLKETYSDINPRVIRLQDKIDRLEAIVLARESGGASSDESANRSQEQAAQMAAIKDADVAIDALQAQVATTKAELDEIAKNITDSAANATQLSALQRDYEIMQNRYRSTVSNLNSARMSERIEATAQGARIQVIENASVPQIPSGPNRLLIAMLSILTGLALAVGYFVLLEALNRSIRRPTELVERFDITPMATIPYMESRTEQLLRRGALVTATLGVLGGVPAALWYVDTTYLPLEVIVQKVLVKLGLG